MLREERLYRVNQWENTVNLPRHYFRFAGETKSISKGDAKGARCLPLWTFITGQVNIGHSINVVLDTDIELCGKLAIIIFYIVVKCFC